MTTVTVEFRYVTGLKRRIFRNARLIGSWDIHGRYCQNWTESPMFEYVGEDGCPGFKSLIVLDRQDQGQLFNWGVILDGPQGSRFWGIPTEVHDKNSVERYRSFYLSDDDTHPQVECFHLTVLRYLGANKRFEKTGARPVLNFAVWAPNAQEVEVVFGGKDSGYIADDGSGIDAARPVVSLSRSQGGVWEGQAPGMYEEFMGVPYMYRVLNAQNETVYRTDIFSRSQIGRGKLDPANESWPGSVDSLDGNISCSVVIDPDVVRYGFDSTPAGEKPELIPQEVFWATEFTSNVPVPTRLQDMVIYELHVGSLGFGKDGPGDLRDALGLLDHLVDLGVNAIELLPMAEFKGTTGWGYGDSHHLCIEGSAGGRDTYRHFVRACHQRGIAVIQDVVYNHYDPHANRAEWQYDSTAPEENIYYWYKGSSSDYSQGDGGYVDNGSTGYTPRFWEEIVRQQFVSSAVFLIEEMHVDGLRVDLTQAIHRDNRLHANGDSVSSANIFGQKFLREWSRTLRMIRPTVLLIAEDHTDWDAVTKLPAQGGLGFGARWDVEFYHSLIGDSDMAGDRARLLKDAGFGAGSELRMDSFSGVLFNSQYNRVVFHESHDEAGNAGGTARTLKVAVNGAELVDDTRSWAEARSRVCFGLSLLSAGTPMFFMGEEVGAQKLYRYDTFLENREDIHGERLGDGRYLYRFYQELITLRRRLSSIRSHNIDILYQSNADRIIAFKRWEGDEQALVLASFNNAPFSYGYRIEKDLLALPNARWKEVFNSDAAAYGGWNIGNGGAVISSSGGCFEAILPASGFVVFIKQ